MNRDSDYTEYVRARRPRLVRAAMLLGCSPTDAEDVVQAALIRCYRHWEKVERAADPDAYAYRVLLNCLSDSRQRAWRREQPTSEVSGPEPPAVATDAVASRMVLVTALRALSEERRIALVLRYFADLSERQIAQATDVPIGTVKSRLSRGLAELSEDPQITDLVGNRRS